MIYKYVVEIFDLTWIDVPGGRGGSSILSVGEQSGKLVVWIQVDPERREGRVPFCIRGTGQTIDGTEGRFIGTVQMKSGLVWHVFEGPR